MQCALKTNPSESAMCPDDPRLYGHLWLAVARKRDSPGYKARAQRIPQWQSFHLIPKTLCFAAILIFFSDFFQECFGSKLAICRMDAGGFCGFYCWRSDLASGRLTKMQGRTNFWETQMKKRKKFWVLNGLQTWIIRTSKILLAKATIDEETP